MRIKIDHLDKRFRRYIRLRDKVCQGCAKESGLLDCAHILSRRYAATRWDPQNAMLLCRGCHMHFTQNPEEWVRFVESKMGEAAYQLLEIKAKHSTTKKKLARANATLILGKAIAEMTK